MMNNVKVETSDTYIDRKIQKEREEERERMIRLEDKERQGVGDGRLPVYYGWIYDFNPLEAEDFDDNFLVIC